MAKLILAKGTQAGHERMVLTGPPAPLMHAKITQERARAQASLWKPPYSVLSTREAARVDVTTEVCLVEKITIESVIGYWSPGQYLTKRRTFT